MAEYRDPTAVTPTNPEYDKNQVNSTVAKYADFIRTKQKGLDTRESMARAIEITNIQSNFAEKLSYETSASQKELEKRVNTSIGQLTEDSEVIDSRTDANGVTQAVLSERLDADFKNLAFIRDQSYLLSVAFQKLRSKKEAIKIVVAGDSLTYGLDQTSTDRRPALPDQPNQNSTRAGVTYPEKLQTIMNEIFPGLVTIGARATPGETAEAYQKRWTTSANADITVFCLGTNDATYGGMKAFQNTYRKLIQRENEWGAGVMVMLPPKQRTTVNLGLHTFRKAIVKLCDECDVPYLDLGIETSNLPANYYSDNIHFNTKGYSFLGAKVANFILSYGKLEVNQLLNGVLSVRDIDGLTVVSGATYAYNTSYPTPDETTSGKGVALIISPGGKIVYTFETLEDNLIAYPNSYLGKNNAAILKMSLDFGVLGQNTSTSTQFGSKQSSLTFDSSVTYTTPKNGNFYNIYYQTYYGAFITELGQVSSESEPVLVIPRKGMHSVTIQNTGTENIQFFGLEFMTRTQLMAQIRSHRTTGVWSKVVSANGEVETTTKITLKELFDSLQYDFSDQNAVYNPPVQVTVKTNNKGVAIYQLQLKAINGGGSNLVLSEQLFKASEKITDGELRVLNRANGATPFTFSADGLVLNWRYATTGLSTVTVQLG
ncbi:SGNH/GDSL hydrolase family protein [Escherichia coli]|uniref:SGNH/GDSL hydrolase family protein n=1 Tax=Enterococcus sp. AZ078 TaxID=2774710 RepID=UPI001365C402|nr:SGNH/GDSL hydrolase family protein [Escherichia coli]